MYQMNDHMFINALSERQRGHTLFKSPVDISKGNKSRTKDFFKSSKVSIVQQNNSS